MCLMGTGMPYLVRVGVRLRVRVGVGVRVRDAVLPDEHLLVVGGGDEPLGVLAEGDRVDGGEVLVVDLLDLARVGVVLHDVLVRAAREEDVLLRRVRVDLVSIRVRVRVRVRVEEYVLLRRVRVDLVRRKVSSL